MMNTPVTLPASLPLRLSLTIEKREPRLSLEESVLKLDAGVTAIAERHVIGCL
jgi:hypothetical protein